VLAKNLQTNKKSIAGRGCLPSCRIVKPEENLTLYLIMLFFGEILQKINCFYFTDFFGTVFQFMSR